MRNRLLTTAGLWGQRAVRACVRALRARTMHLALFWIFTVVACADSAAPFVEPGPVLGKGLPSSVLCAEPGSLFVPSPLPPSPTVAAGTIPGSFSVSQEGSAVYAMPLEVVPGRGAMQPSLAVTYDSAADEGWLGHGFTVTGFSAISRCPKSLRRDGEIEPIGETEEDALCLDGRRLIPVDPASATPTEFRTFPDTHTKIVAEYAPGWDPARGPTSFRAYLKSGLVHAYGRADSGQVLSRKGVVRAWLLTQVFDRSGSWQSFTYRNDKDLVEGYTVEHAPLRIDYTGHDLAPPSRAVVFEYQKREKPDTRVLFARGMALKRSLLLKRIKMLGPGDELVREYDFTFTTAPSTKRTLLHQVTECAADMTCRPPTRFTWHHGSGVGFVQQPTALKDPESERASVMLADVTGDGLDDLVIGDVDVTGGSEQPITNFLVAPNKGTEVTPEHFNTSALAHQILHVDPTLPVQPDRGTSLDYNHDGLADLFLHDIYSMYPTWRILLAKADRTFAMLDTGIARPYAFGAAPMGLVAWDASAHLLDATGDGMTDLLACAWNGVDHTWGVHFWKPDGPGFEPTWNVIPELHAYPCNAELHTIDIDIDGATDLLVHEVTETANGPIFGTTYDALSYRHSTAGWVRTKTNLPLAPSGEKRRIIFLDANGDALPDAIQMGFQDGQPRTFFNTGRGFQDPVLSLPAALPEADKFAQLATVIDWNADGQQDLLLPLPNLANLPVWRVLQSTGSVADGGFAIEDPGIPFEPVLEQEGMKLASPFGPRVTDFDGDGIQDVLIVLNGQFRVFKNKLFEEDLLATVTDGLSAFEPGEAGYRPNVQIHYDHLIDRAKTVGDVGGIPSVPAMARTYLPREHAKEDACAYPVRCVVGPRRVVSGYELNTGQDKPRSFQVAYRNARFDRLGQGSLGFEMRIVRDLDTDAGTAELFDIETFDPNLNVFPFAGLVEQEWRWSPTLLREGDSPQLALELLFTKTARQAIPTSGGATYFARFAGEQKRREQAMTVPLTPLSIEAKVRDIAENGGAYVLSDTKRLVQDFDAWGNHLEELLFTEGAESELLIKRTFEVDEGTWLIGQLTKQTECSTVSGVQQCRKVERAFDAEGRLKREEASGASGDLETKLTVKLSRDDFGNVRLFEREDGFGERRVECTTYDAEGIYPYAHTNAAGHTSYMRFDKRLGELSVLVEANGLVTKWGYDGLGRRTSEVRPDGTTTSYELTRTKDGGPLKNAWNLKLRTVTPGWEDDTVELDALGRPVRSWTQGVSINGQPAERIMQEVAFDALGERIARRSVPAGELTPPGDLVHDYMAYDRMGRVLKHVTPWGAATRYEYLGRLVRVAAPNGGLTEVENDPLGRPTKIVDAEGGSTLYSYGPFGTLRTVTDPDGAMTIMERDAFGRVRKHASPDRGTTESHYNGFDEQTSALDAENREFKFFYDALSRRVARLDDDGLTTWTYDTAPNGIGELAEVINPAGDTITYSYDLFGRPYKTQRTVDGVPYASKVDYDKHGRVWKVTYPQPAGAAPFVVRHEFDAHGNLLAVNDALTQAPYWKLLATDAAGRTTEEEFGAQSATTKRAYFEDKNRIKSILTTAGGKQVQKLSYAFNERLNLLYRKDGLQNITEHFTHDLLDRLTSSWFDPGLGHPQVYAYSPGGNLLKKPGVGALTYQPFRPHTLSTAGGEQYDHDNVGNQTVRPGATITYTSFDLPATITQVGLGTVTFSYDGNQQRIRKLTPQAETIYFGDLYERITPMDPSLPVEHRYSIYNGERLVASVTRRAGEPDETRFVHVDHLGSIDVLTDESGAVKERRSHDAFGSRRSPVWKWGQPKPAPASGTAKDFTGHEGDEDVGLVNARGRLYDPKLGQFLSPDPLVSQPGFGQSWHPFAYCFNSPLAYVDPSGFQVQELSSQDEAVTWPDGKPITVYVFGEPRKKKEPSKDAKEDGATLPPTDLGVTGNTAGAAQEQPPTSTELPRSGGDIALDVGLGIADGLFDLGAGVGTTLLLNALTLGGYSTYQFGASMWQGYWDRNGGIIGAINEVNPFYQIGKAGAQSYLAFVGGDYHEGASKAITAAVLAAVTVVGIVQGAGALAGKPPPAGGAAAGGGGSTAAQTTKAVTAGEAGAYGDLAKRAVKGDDLTPHHMPQAAMRFTPYERGGALVMKRSEHQATRTHGTRGRITAAAEKGSSFRDALARDIRDVRQLTGTRYDPGLRSLLQYYKKNFPELMAR